jgi:hypothetical protein
MNEPASPKFSAPVNRILRRAVLEAESVNAAEVTVNHLMIGLLQEASIQELMKKDLTVELLRGQIPA